MQPQAAEPDQDQPGHRGDARLRQVLDHHRGHPVHRRVHVEQRAAQDAGGTLQERVPEVDVDEIVPALRHLRRRM